MLTFEETEYLRANPRFLVRELLSRNIDVTVLDWELEVFEARLGDHIELFQDIDSSIMPYTSSTLASNKAFCKLLLQRNNISVPRGERLNVLERIAAIEIASAIGFPVVLKPCFGVQGEQVHMELFSEEELSHALDSVYQKLGPVEVLIEQQCQGHEHRIFITRNGEYAVLQRDPAHIIGNGRSNIEDLARTETERRMNPRKNCLCPIVLDDEARRYLQRRGLSFKTVPTNLEKVYLRGSSNIKMGGVAIDRTDVVHPSIIDLARNVLECISGLPYAGIDFLGEDISQPIHTQKHWILEINSLPGIGMHLSPAIGKSRNVAAMLVDMIFPEVLGLKDMSKIAA